MKLIQSKIFVPRAVNVSTPLYSCMSFCINKHSMMCIFNQEKKNMLQKTQSEFHAKLVYHIAKP